MLRAQLRQTRWALLAYAVLGVALWPVPLLGLVHVEASAVVAFASFFVAGLAALRGFRRGRAFGRVLGVQEGLLVVPLVLLTATLLWRPNCDYGRGLLFYVLFPPVTVVFAVALAYLLTGMRARFRKTLLVGLGLGISLLGPLYDLGLHPQFYTYNHVFGGALGPIYDEELALRPGLFAFRALTLLWALLLFLLGRWFRVRERRRNGRFEDRRSRTENRNQGQGERSILYLLSSILVLLLIGTAYLNADTLGFNTSAEEIQEALGGHVQTEHFDLYFDPDTLSGQRLAYVAEDHEWRYRWLRERLGTAPQERIASYLYPDAETKARLTGARRTSVAPVWLRRPQTHVLLAAYERSFGHELVHAFSRAFGLPLVKASRSVGLVEGLAVAFEPPSGRPSPADQVSAAVLMEVGDRQARSLAEDVAARLSPLGFWTGRGAVGYTTMGAFVRFLADRYGARKLRRVYAWGDFEAVYGRPLAALAEEWQAALLARSTVARSAGALAGRRFAQLSLFEKPCPHYVPPYRRAYRAGREALAAGDTSAAAEAFGRALARQPAYEPARVFGARLLLAGGQPSEAQRLLRAAPEARHGSAFYRVRGDARVLLGQPRPAQKSYARALGLLPLYRHDLRAVVRLRALLAGTPAPLRALAGGGPARARARRLENLEHGPAAPAVATLRALLLAEGERYEAAARLLEKTTPPGAQGSATHGALRRQRLAWLAQFWSRAEAPVRAAAAATRAAQAFQTLGDYDTAARLEEISQKMTWAQQRRTAP